MASEPLPARLRKYLLISLLGNGLEWYDFAIFGYFAPIFSRQFFPTTSSLVSLMNTFAIFAVGFLCRPLGAYIFGRLGDQQGRKAALLLSMLLMALSTSLMGILPTYDQVGITAPILLTLLRIFQGISLGGEYTGSLSFIIEHSPPTRRGFIGACNYSGVYLGSAFGASVGALVTIFTTSEQLQAWGWRIPFFVGFVMALLGYNLRRKIEETPLFLELKKSKSIVKSPLKKLLKENSSEMLLAIGIMLPSTVWVYLLFVYLPTYLSQMRQWELFQSLTVNLIPLMVLFVSIPYAGHLSDYWGRKKVIFLGQILLIIIAPISFLNLSEGGFIQVMFLQTLIALFFALSYGPTAALFAELFPTNVRSTGMAISYHIATGVFGGLTPLILTSLSSINGSPLWPMVWLLSASVVGMISLIKIKETRTWELQPGIH